MITLPGYDERLAPGTFDEYLGPDHQPRLGWKWLLDALDEVEDLHLGQVAAEVRRLLDAYGVTYTPSPAATVSLVDETARTRTGQTDQPDQTQAVTSAQPWHLDSVPIVIDAVEWRAIERGLIQRAELLDLILTDLYSQQNLLRDRTIPAELVFDNPEYLRPAVGLPVDALRLHLLGADLGRDRDGSWTVLTDRAQAPSGAGYAMQNRRVLSRVLAEVFHQAPLQRLTPFFQTLRSSLVNAAPHHTEDPRVVVLTPGARSETAFDQAFLSAMLGFPLVEGSDLTVRDSTVWMRVTDTLEQVDVILRRVDSSWVDPLELRAGSRLGSAGLLECVRHGSVRVVNSIGSGLLENPGFMPLLPRLCERLLGESLRLPSVPTYWCGDPAMRSHVLANLGSLVIRSTDRSRGRSVRGEALSGAERDTLTDAIRARPHAFVGQEDLPLSTSPQQHLDSLAPGRVLLRPFVVRDANGYPVMAGGLGRTGPVARTSKLLTLPGDVSKDVWVVAPDHSAPADVGPRPRTELVLPRHGAQVALVPRVLEDLYWLGRYGERAEDLLRLLLATEPTSTSDRGSPVDQAEQVMLAALAEVTGSGLRVEGEDGRAVLSFLRQLVLDEGRPGTVAQSVQALRGAAIGVRDQLSDDIWMTLAQVDDAAAALRRSRGGPALVGTAETSLTGLLALCGVISENMLRDTGWYLLDIGRGLERALQVLRLLQSTVLGEREPAVERIVLEAVLAASESIITHRRRYRGRIDVLTVVDLLVLDTTNPRSVAYQSERIRTDLERIASTRSVDSLRAVAAVDTLVTRADLLDALGGGREALGTFLAELAGALGELSQSLRQDWMRPPPSQVAMLPQGWS